MIVTADAATLLLELLLEELRLEVEELDRLELVLLELERLDVLLEELSL